MVKKISLTLALLFLLNSLAFSQIMIDSESSSFDSGVPISISTEVHPG